MCKYHYSYFSLCQHQETILVKQCQQALRYHNYLARYHFPPAPSPAETSPAREQDVGPTPQRSSKTEGTMIVQAESDLLSNNTTVVVEHSAKVHSLCGGQLSCSDLLLPEYEKSVTFTECGMQQRDDMAALSWNDPNAPICRSPHGDAYMRTVSPLNDQSQQVLKDLDITFPLLNKNTVNQTTSAKIPVWVTKPTLDKPADEFARLSPAQRLMALEAQRDEEEKLGLLEMNKEIEKNDTIVHFKEDIKSVKSFPALGPNPPIKPLDAMPVEAEPVRKISWAKMASAKVMRKGVEPEALSGKATSNAQTLSRDQSAGSRDARPTAATKPTGGTPTKQRRSTVRFSDALCSYRSLDGAFDESPPKDQAVSVDKQTTRMKTEHMSCIYKFLPHTMVDSPFVQNMEPMSQMPQNAVSSERLRGSPPRLQTAQRAAMRGGGSTMSISSLKEQSISLTVKPSTSIRQSVNLRCLPEEWIKAGDSKTSRSKRSSVSSITSSPHDRSTIHSQNVSDSSSLNSPTKDSPNSTARRVTKLAIKVKDFKSHSPSQIPKKISIATLNRLSRPKYITPKLLSTPPGPSSTVTSAPVTEEMEEHSHAEDSIASDQSSDFVEKPPAESPEDCVMVATSLTGSTLSDSSPVYTPISYDGASDDRDEPPSWYEDRYCFSSQHDEITSLLVRREEVERGRTPRCPMKATEPKASNVQLPRPRSQSNETTRSFDEIVKEFLEESAAKAIVQLDGHDCPGVDIPPGALLGAGAGISASAVEPNSKHHRTLSDPAVICAVPPYETLQELQASQNHFNTKLHQAAQSFHTSRSTLRGEAAEFAPGSAIPSGLSQTNTSNTGLSPLSNDKKKWKKGGESYRSGSFRGGGNGSAAVPMMYPTVQNVSATNMAAPFSYAGGIDTVTGGLANYNIPEFPILPAGLNTTNSYKSFIVTYVTDKFVETQLISVPPNNNLGFPPLTPSGNTTHVPFWNHPGRVPGQLDPPNMNDQIIAPGQILTSPGFPVYPATPYPVAPYNAPSGSSSGSATSPSYQGPQNMVMPPMQQPYEQETTEMGQAVPPYPQHGSGPTILINGQMQTTTPYERYHPHPTPCLNPEAYATPAHGAGEFQMYSHYEENDPFVVEDSPATQYSRSETAKKHIHGVQSIRGGDGDYERKPRASVSKSHPPPTTVRGRYTGRKLLSPVIEGTECGDSPPPQDVEEALLIDDIAEMACGVYEIEVAQEVIGSKCTDCTLVDMEQAAAYLDITGK